MIKIYNMDVMKALKMLPDESIDMQICSPPYWGLRDYGEGVSVKWSDGWFGQLGLEPDFNLYIKHLADIFDEVKRVLKKDGTCWINLGDTYSGGVAHSDFQNVERYTLGGDWKREPFISDLKKNQIQAKCLCAIPERFIIEMINRGWILRNKIIWHKPNHMPSSVKDRFAGSWEYLFFFSKNKKYYFDLDAVREPHKESSIKRTQQNKGNPNFNPSIRNQIGGMDTLDPNQFCHPKGRNPDDVIKEKVTKEMRDEIRSKGLTEGFGYKISYNNPKGKNPDDIIQTRSDFDTEAEYRAFIRKGKKYTGKNSPQNTIVGYNPLGKNPSDFWDITTRGYPEAHFAVFPEKLIERPIKTTPMWICNKCGKARERITRTEYDIDNPNPKGDEKKARGNVDTNFKSMKFAHGYAKHITEGWTTCNCNAGFKPATILDIFAGSGTTLKVARDHGRDAIGIEIKKEYVDLIKKRLMFDKKGNRNLHPEPIIENFK